MGRDRDAVVAMLPHLVWLKQVILCRSPMPATSMGGHDREMTADLRIGYAVHNLALLALARPAGAARARHRAALAVTGRVVAAHGRAAPNPGVNISQALNVWIIRPIVAIGPPLGALLFVIYMKTDWGISLFFLVPLALVALSGLALRRWRCSTSRRSGSWSRSPL